MPSLPLDESSLQAGDHIYCHRKMYTHHGIYEGNGMVIHLTKTKKRRNKQREGPCQVCGFDRGTDNVGGVARVCLGCFVKGKDVYRFEYGVSFMRFMAKKKGTCTMLQLCFRPEKVVERAQMVLEAGLTNSYNFLRNNCEGFAFHCTVGKCLSMQSVIGTVQTGVTALAVPIAAVAYHVLIKKI